jgi:hypothetical protein
MLISLFEEQILLYLNAEDECKRKRHEAKDRLKMNRNVAEG